MHYVWKQGYYSPHNFNFKPYYVWKHMCSLFVLLKTKNFCIILCNVKVSIYACTMCGNKDINRRILLTLNCILCGNICVLP